MEIILENTKKKLETVERLLDYLSSILFRIDRILEVVYLSDTGTYIFIQKEILLKRDLSSQEELFCGVYLDLNTVLNSTESYIELKKTNEFNFNFLDSYEELESLTFKTNFEKSFLLLLDKIYNLEKFYEKLLPRVKNLVPKISILYDCYANPKYFNTKFPIQDHDLEMFFEVDLQLIKKKINYFLPIKVNKTTDKFIRNNEVEYGKNLKESIELFGGKSKTPILVLFLYYSSKAKKINPNGEAEWRNYFQEIGINDNTGWIKYFSPMKGFEQKHLELRVHYYQKVKESELEEFLNTYEDLIKLAELDLLEYKKLYPK